MSQVQELLAVAVLAGSLLVLADGQKRESTSAPATGSTLTAEPKSTRPTEHRAVHRGAPSAVRKAARCTRQPSPAAQPVAPIVKNVNKRERPKPKVKPTPHRTAALPSCAAVRREYERMSYGQRWDAYMRATPEQVAHGRRCLQI